MVSKAKIAANARYNVKKYDVVSFRVSKDENINQRIDDAVKAIQEATGNDKYSKAAFILDAIRAKLDGQQPAQAPQPQPTTTTPTAPATSTPQPPEGYTLIPDRPGLEPIKVLLPVDKRYNQRIYAAVKQGRAPSGAMYVMAALDKQLAADEADEKRKLDLYFAAMDDDY